VVSEARIKEWESEGGGERRVSSILLLREVTFLLGENSNFAHGSFTHG
jgi:hypothetical protein